MEALRELIVGAVAFLVLAFIAAVGIGGIVLAPWGIVAWVRPWREGRKSDDG